MQADQQTFHLFKFPMPGVMAARTEQLKARKIPQTVRYDRDSFNKVVSDFLSELGPDRVISMDTSETRIQVWYWK